MVNIGISSENRKKIVGKLGKILSNQYVLQIKIQNFHWNVVSSDFGQLHAFFQTQYEQVADSIDDVAERIRSLGEFSPGSMSEFLQHATLREDVGHFLKDIEMLKRLLEGYEHIICQIRAELDEIRSLGDAGTENFLTDLMEKYEKTAWMIRSHLPF